MIPPIPVRTVASRRNCTRMSDFRAPIALRTPISLVRSVTEISMIFITPIPPTIRPTELMILVNITSAPVSCFHRFDRKSGDVISKSFSWLCFTCRSRRMASVTSSLALSGFTSFSESRRPG